LTNTLFALENGILEDPRGPGERPWEKAKAINRNPFKGGGL